MVVFRIKIVITKLSLPFFERVIIEVPKTYFDCFHSHNKYNDLACVNMNTAWFQKKNMNTANTNVSCMIFYS